MSFMKSISGWCNAVIDLYPWVWAYFIFFYPTWQIQDSVLSIGKIPDWTLLFISLGKLRIICDRKMQLNHSSLLKIEKELRRYAGEI